MAINTTTFESTLQTKLNDTTLAAKEMLLLGKALEATSGNIAVSNVTAEGTTQVARVVAAMTGALPAQSGQAGKVLTSDGTNSSWQEGLPSQTGQSAKFLTTDGTSANWEALSSSALGIDIEVAAGTSVSTGDVVNFYNNKVGANPTPNSQTSLATSSTQNYRLANESGTIVLDYFTGRTNDHDVTVGVVQSDGSIVWGSPIAIYTGYSMSTTTVMPLGGDNFAMGGYEYKGSSSGASYSYLVFFTINPVTGGLTGKSNAITDSYSSHGSYNRVYHRVRMLSSTKVLMRTYKDNPGYGGSSHQSYVCTFTNSGSISRDSISDNPILGDDHTRAYIVGANTKVLHADTNANWKLSSWNGTVTSSMADIQWDTNYQSDSMVYRPDENVDKFVVAFKDTSNKFVVNTYNYLNSTLTLTNQHVLVANGVGVTLGRLVGDGDNIVIGYEDNSKGYIVSLTLDPTTKNVNGSGLPLLSNTANKAVHVYGPSDTNKYLGIFSNSSELAVSTKSTMAAYATIPLNWVGVASADASAGSLAYVIVDGVAGGFTGLTPGLTYYYNTATYDATISTTESTFKVGRAVSTTEILLDA